MVYFSNTVDCVGLPWREFMSIKNRMLNLNTRRLRGQNVIEYLLLTAIMALICLAFFHPVSGPAKTAMDNILNDTVQDIDRIRNEIQW
mgnify:CR=1 FL=1